jgi:hypothetical protein
MREDNLVRGALDRLTGRKPIESKPVPTTSKDWLGHWRELAQLTYGITAQDSRFESVMQWLNVCHTAFALGSWSPFCEAAQEVKATVKRNPFMRDKNRVV